MSATVRAVGFNAIEEEVVFLTRDPTGFGLKQRLPNEPAVLESLQPEKQRDLFGRTFASEEELVEWIAQLRARQVFIESELEKWETIRSKFSEQLRAVSPRETLQAVLQAENVNKLVQAAQLVQEAAEREFQNVIRKQSERLNRIELKDLNSALEQNKGPAELSEQIFSQAIQILLQNQAIYNACKPEQLVLNPKKYVLEFTKILNELLQPALRSAQEQFQDKMREHFIKELRLQRGKVGRERFDAVATQLKSVNTRNRQLSEITRDAEALGLPERDLVKTASILSWLGVQISWDL